MSEKSLASPIPKTRKEQVTAAMTRLALELCALDIQFAVVTYDLQAQDEESTRVTYAGNVSLETGQAMMEQASNPDARVTISHKESASFDLATIN